MNTKDGYAISIVEADFASESLKQAVNIRPIADNHIILYRIGVVKRDKRFQHK
jgi:hypothetical protein